MKNKCTEGKEGNVWVGWCVVGWVGFGGEGFGLNWMGLVLGGWGVVGVELDGV
jgi:hypothetical protein